MRYLEEKYGLLCVNIFQQYGFKKRRNTFIRITNDVMQKFHLQQSIYGGSYVIGFGIIPLCIGIIKEYVADGVLCPYYLSQFNGRWAWWTYDKKSTDSIDASLREVEDILTHKLLPLFIHSESSESAFESLCSLEREYYQRAGLPIREEQRKYIRENINMLDESKRYMALKCKNYNYALESCEMLLQQEIEALSSCMKSFPEDLIQRRQASIEATKREIVHLKAKDDQYFSTMLLANEHNSNALLRKMKLIVQEDKIGEN